MNRQQAIEKITKEYGVELVFNNLRSKSAGYPIYEMEKGDEFIGWVSDTNTMLEVNLEDGTTKNIWLDICDDKEFASLLAKWLEPYTDEVINKVLKRKEEFRNDNTTIKLLKVLSKEIEEDRKYLESKILENIEHGFEFNRTCLSNTKSIRDTLYLLWIK